MLMLPSIKAFHATGRHLGGGGLLAASLLLVVLPFGHACCDLDVQDREWQASPSTSDPLVLIRADNSGGPGGPTGPLCTPIWTSGTLFGLTKTH